MTRANISNEDSSCHLITYLGTDVFCSTPKEEFRDIKRQIPAALLLGLLGLSFTFSLYSD